MYSVVTTELPDGVDLVVTSPGWRPSAPLLAQAGLESSDPWNNAGTGHASLCELNYTPEGPDGTIDAATSMEIPV